MAERWLSNLTRLACYVMALVAFAKTLLLMAYVPSLIAMGMPEVGLCLKSSPFQVIVAALNFPLPTLTALHLLRVASSPDLFGAAFFSVLNWMSAADVVIDDASTCDHGRFLYNAEAEETSEGETWPLSTRLLAYGVVLVFNLKVACHCILVMGRLASLETRSLTSFGLRWARPVGAVLLPMPLITAVAAMEGWTTAGIFLVTALSLTTLCFLALMFAALMRAWRAITKAAEVVSKAASSQAASKREVEQAALAVRMLRAQTVSLAGSMSCHAAAACLYLWLKCALGMEECHRQESRWELWLAFRILLWIGADLDCLLALSLSGALSGAAAAARASMTARLMRARRHAAQRRKVEALRRSRGDSEVWQGWDKKVEELAGRAISVQALLQFYKELPLRMPHFDAAVHSTADVVRQVVVPQSAGAKSALAPLLMGGQEKVPDVMVTHGWGGLFRDLVATVCADALQETDYERVAHLLDRSIVTLESWIGALGRLQCGYWICAFAVNQHQGICGNLSSKTDPVTKAALQDCACGCEKVWNTTAPLLPDGRSVACEMNKFDDMMSFLSSKNPDFAQAVAVDGDFRLFSRAWCVAEIAQAGKGGMEQRIKVASAESVESRKEELRKLRIQDMEAAVEADKAYILQSIGGEEEQEAFNKDLRSLLLQELLPAWSSLDASQQMGLAGVMLRWSAAVYAAGRAVTPPIW